MAEHAIMKSDEMGIEAPAPINTGNVTGGMYTSFKAETREEKLAVFKAVSASELLEDHINETLLIRDVIIQPVEIVDKLTGEIKRQNRFTLITADGKAYAATSLGVEVVMRNLFGIVGEPTWEPPLAMVAKKEQGSNGYKYTTLYLAE